MFVSTAMQNNALTRRDIVDALDDLNEREEISSAWVEDGGVPYPPKALQERSKRLQERLQLRRGAFILLMFLVGITGGLGIVGWTIPGALPGFLAGFGGVFVVASLFTDPWAEDQVRALQLYDLLRQLDGDAETVSDPPTAEGV
jgi:hypothetical protein